MNNAFKNDAKWSENVIIADADFVDKVAFDLIVNFERMLMRRIPRPTLHTGLTVWLWTAEYAREKTKYRLFSSTARRKRVSTISHRPVSAPTLTARLSKTILANSPSAHIPWRNLQANRISWPKRHR